jgi:hypothetical protein
MSLLGSAARTGLDLAALPLRVTEGAVRSGRELEREARAQLAVRGEQALIDVVDAVVVRLLERDFIDLMLIRIEESGVAQRIADRLLEDGIAEQVTERVLAGPELERIVRTAFESSLPDELIAQALRSEAVWVLVDEIARSPSVTEAISHQGTGFLEQVAEKTRDRSRVADARVARFAQRLRRKDRGELPNADPGELPLPPGAPSGGT